MAFDAVQSSMDPDGQRFFRSIEAEFELQLLCRTLRLDRRGLRLGFPRPGRSMAAAGGWHCYTEVAQLWEAGLARSGMWLGCGRGGFFAPVFSYPARAKVHSPVHTFTTVLTSQTRWR